MGYWLRNPLALLAEGAGGGLVVENGQIIEFVATGKQPTTPVAEWFDASRHIIIPGLNNTHHHVFQTSSRAHPQGINKELFPWLTALMPIWGRLDRGMFGLAARLAMTGLLMSGCTTALDHNYLVLSGIEDATDIEVEEECNLGIRATISRGGIVAVEKRWRHPAQSHGAG